jgi:hypothetical protein
MFVSGEVGEKLVHAKVSADSLHAIDGVWQVSRQIVVPSMTTESGTVTAEASSIEVDSGGSAGQQHIKLPTDVEADVFQELVSFEFPAADNVKAILIGLLTEPGAVPESLRLVYTLNGDIVSDATKLMDESDDVLTIPAGQLARVQSPVANITRVAAIAIKGNASLTKTSNTTLTLWCQGLGE